MVDNALIGTAEFDMFSLNPSTCTENWRTHLQYPGALLPANRGAAYMDGILYRGTQDGLVYIGNAGSDNKGGKGHLYALEGKSGKIVWEFLLAPPVPGDVARGPLGATPLDLSTWNNAPGIPISGAGAWISYTLELKNGLLYGPGGNPAPDFASRAREGGNLFFDSVVVLGAETGNFRNNFKVVPKNWHDYDVSNPPILLQTMGGKQLMADAPKDGHLYGYDLATNNLLYRVPATTIEHDADPAGEAGWGAAETPSLANIRELAKQT